jgi:alkaline phosphatase
MRRREFLAGSGAAALGALPWRLHSQPDAVPAVSFGIVTDCHYADIAPSGNRYYRESEAKLAECVGEMNRRGVDFLIELGDFKDQGTTATATLDYLRVIEDVYKTFNGPRYHVLGNHDMDRISKRQFLTAVENTGVAPPDSFYSFDVKGFHFVVLDANFRPDGTGYDSGNFDWAEACVPPPQLDWLAADLAATALPSVVFIHQLLDADTGPVYVRNAAEVRNVLERSRRVRAVFQGHHHAGAYRRRGTIHYYTLKGMIEGTGEESNAYAVVSVLPDGSLAVEGLRRAESRILAGGAGTAAGFSGNTLIDTRAISMRWSVPVEMDTRTPQGTRILLS